MANCKERVSRPDSHGPGMPFLYSYTPCYRKAVDSGRCKQHAKMEAARVARILAQRKPKEGA